MDRRPFMRMPGPTPQQLRLARVLAGIPLAQEPPPVSRREFNLPPFLQGSMMPESGTEMPYEGPAPARSSPNPNQQMPAPQHQAPIQAQPLPAPAMPSPAPAPTMPQDATMIPPLPPPQQVGPPAQDPRYLPEQWRGAFSPGPWWLT